LRKSLASLSILLCFAVRALAHTPPSDTSDGKDAAVDAVVRVEMQRHHIPGLALGIYRDGKIVRAQGYGMANVEWEVPVKPDTVFQSGSIGKQFVATAVMILVEEGEVSLEDSIQKYFPDAPESWKDISVRNLLNHTSGLAEYEISERNKARGPFYWRLDFTEDELYKQIAELPLDFKPNERWGYRNTNYTLLGILIHRVTGKFYGDFLQERIFKPLGMTDTRIISDEDIIPHRAAGYRLVSEQLKNQEWVSPTFNSTAEGSLYFTILDLEKWDAALYTEKLLKKSSFSQMWTPGTLLNGKRYPYGFGWRVEDANGHQLLAHGGAWQGFTSAICRYVDDRLTVVVLTNLGSPQSDPNRIAHRVAGIYVPDLSPAALKPIADKEPQVTALLRTTLADLTADKPNTDSFAPDDHDLWTAQRVKGLSELLESFGALESLDLIERKENGTKRSYRYRATFTETFAMVNMSLDGNDKISALQIRSQ
jgi:CubicO group peptidase (beta-lactamase class C family)